MLSCCPKSNLRVSQFNLQEVRPKFLSRINYLFQPGFVARLKCYILLNFYIELLLKYIIQFVHPLPPGK